MRFVFRSLVLAFLFLPISVPTLTQVSAPQDARFRIEGTVTDPSDAVVPATEITFRGDVGTVRVPSDAKGFYHADLPLGAYTLNTRVPQGFRAYTRPLFRVDSPTSLVFNIVLQFGRNNCDIVVLGKDSQPATEKEWAVAAKDFCGGEDFFPLPSRNGTRYSVSIQYQTRSRSVSGYEYTCEWTPPSFCSPVSVAYNLLTLQAKHVFYDPEHHRIKATGDVVALQNGIKTTAESMTLVLAEGEAKLNP